MAPERDKNAIDDREGDLAMSRYADGRDDAFATVYEILAPRLHTFLLRMTRNVALADDLLQETFLRVHRARGSFAKGAKLLPWGYAVARNVYIDHTRTAQTRKEMVVAADDAGVTAADRLISGEGDGEASLAAKELAGIVDAALAALPPNQREAFILIRYEGLSVADAAAILGASDGAVKLRAFHAYEALRAALAARGAGPERAAPKKEGR